MPSIPLSVPLERQSPSKMELEDLDNGTGAVPQTCGSARKYECSPDEGGSLASSSSVVATPPLPRGWTQRGTGCTLARHPRQAADARDGQA